MPAHNKIFASVAVEALTTLEDTKRIAQRVFGGAHPLTPAIEGELRVARAVLRARETPPPQEARKL